MSNGILKYARVDSVSMCGGKVSDVADRDGLMPFQNIRYFENGFNCQSINLKHETDNLMVEIQNSHILEHLYLILCCQLAATLLLGAACE